jgi:MoxR-like ATPase
MKREEAYTGKDTRKMPDFEVDAKLTDPNGYIPSKALKDAVNVAIWLGKPLLLTGEPGTGKTQLAANVAYNFGLAPLLRFDVRTTSVATDLFYRYDAIRHFQFSRKETNSELTNDEIEARYITYEPLGIAIRSNQRQVVLIDEIDKAPRDLPNDILNILEDLTFKVPEINKHFSCSPTKRPLIIFTSNSEKNLPDAFLRRCVYHHIPFPSPGDLLDIVISRTEGKLFTVNEIQSSLIPHFNFLRSYLKKKKPSTAELLNWLVVLRARDFDIQKLPAVSNDSVNYTTMNVDDRESFYRTLSVICKTEEDLAASRKLLGIKDI